ncbi:hypothetical protein [Rhodopirellula europaea]|uniref:hypothetical protein n=1 Tax=Rhodopirellula europaea TaxID=1263866 RepID=UPI003D28D76A
MGLGKRKQESQQSLWLATDKLYNVRRNAFYDCLNQLHDEVDFDERLEEAVEPCYEKPDRDSIASGTYFRIIFIAYDEDISS